MKKITFRIFFSLVLGFIIAAPFILLAQEEVQTSLPHEMTAEEWLRRDEIGKNFVSTPPPTGEIRGIAEFEPMEGVLIRYPFGLPLNLIAALSQNTKLYTIVASTAQQTTVTTQYNNNGVNLANCEWVIAPSNSYWTRDYGPWFVHYGTLQTGIIDFPYNRPRPLDDEIPKVVATQLNLSWFGMYIVHTGGNYMTTGYGISASTQLVETENDTIWTPAQIDSVVLSYMGIATYHKVPDPNNTYIEHIDCWGKFLSPDKVLIRSVPTSHPQYTAIENTAAYFAAATSPYGTPFQIFRVNTPNDEPYSNSLLLNKTVYLPYKGNAVNDSAAKFAYQQALPGYQVLGYTGSWESTDALHCRAIGLADRGMLEILHTPLLGSQPVLPQYNLTATITPYSEMGVYPDSAILYYKVNNGPYSQVAMTNTSGYQYQGIIPGQAAGSVISYYIFAADSSGRRMTHPYVGEIQPHVFNLGVAGIGEISGKTEVPGMLVNVTPNPCHGFCDITLLMTSLVPVSLDIYSIQGQLIKTIVQQPLGTGNYHFCWDATTQTGEKASKGLYLCKLNAGGYNSTLKIVIQ
ncbi:MAG: agmatine deiminase family protein [Bacteroidetes bacterium]|nr:agmatine deiminase family protein [Bacteroidota bacterium]